MSGHVRATKPAPPSQATASAQTGPHVEHEVTLRRVTMPRPSTVPGAPGMPDLGAQIQRAARAGHQFDGAKSPNIGHAIQQARSGGQRLKSGVRNQLESGLGTTLSGVRVHADQQSDRLARSVSAVAFTSGNDIFFRSGAYAPGSPSGMRLLAHEAVHTVQQQRGPVAGTPTDGGISVSDPSDRFERAAAEIGEQVALGQDAGAAHATVSTAPQPAVQRQHADDASLDDLDESDEALQMMPAPAQPLVVQREKVKKKKKNQDGTTARRSARNRQSTTRWVPSGGGRPKGPPRKKGVSKPKNPYSARNVDQNFLTSVLKSGQLITQSEMDKEMAKKVISFAGIKHHNIPGNQNVLRIPLKRQVTRGTVLFRHFQNIYSLSKKQKQKQTPQNRTELLGEAMTATSMMSTLGKPELVYEFSQGVGIDQIWKDSTSKIYHIVEAKGPGATTNYNPFAVRGTNGNGGLQQMSWPWVQDRLIRLSDTALRDEILDDCGYDIDWHHKPPRLIFNFLKGKGWGLQGRVVSATVSDDGTLGSSTSNRQTFL